jgi:hypothetical protein
MTEKGRFKIVKKESLSVILVFLEKKITLLTEIRRVQKLPLHGL